MFTLTPAFLRAIFYLSSFLPPSSWIRKPVSHKALLSLPEEVMYEILHCLDWRDILAVKSTCRRLRAITQTRLLWLYRALELSFSSGVPLLEGPPEAYTSEELEQMVIRRLQTRQKWRELDSSRFRWRGLKFDFWSQGNFHLLPGGRWLFDNINGRVYVADLDSSEMTWSLLFDESQCDNYSKQMDPLGHSTVWIDSSKPWLSVRFALHNVLSHNDIDSTRICIYQLDLTGHGSDTWTAGRIITLQTPASCMKRELRLENDHVLERCLHDNGRNPGISKIHVYRYSDVPSRSCAWEYGKPARIHLLPNDRLVMITETHIEISTMKPVGSDGLALEPTFRVPLDSSPILSNISRVYTNGNCFYIITANSDSINAIQIPRDVTIEPKLRNLAVEKFPARSRNLGFSLMVRLRTDYTMDFITYRLDEERDQVDSHVHLSAFPGVRRMRLEACDEASGRLILCRDGDYALLQV